MRPNPQRLCPLKLITGRVVSLGVVTVSLLESLVGSWVSIFMQRQRLLCTLDLSFKAIHCGASGEQVLRMSPSLKDELISCCILGTMTVCNLRAKTLGVIKATDASDWGMASVEAALPAAIAREAPRFALSKSVWTKLLPPSKAWLKMKQLISADEELPGDEVFDTHPFWALLANFPPYKELWRKPYERSCHINIGEMTAHLKEEARAGSQYSSSRCCYALDSQVALGALVKGRSSSCGLSSLLKRSLAIQLGYDLYSNFGIFPSAINRADGPTRGTQPAAPSVSGPPFWRTLSRGQYEDFERWLADRGLRESEAAIHEEFVPLGARQRHDVPAGGLSVGGETTVEEEVRGSETGAGSVSELSQEAQQALNRVPSKFILWPKGSTKQFSPPGALDLYSGTGGVARQLISMGCPFVIVVDWKKGSEANLLDEDVRALVLLLISTRAVCLVGSAIICSSFSKAVTPSVRSPRFPRGLPGMRRSMRQKVVDGNSHSDLNVVVIYVRLSKTTFGSGWRILIPPIYGFSGVMAGSDGRIVIGCTELIFAGSGHGGGNVLALQLHCHPSEDEEFYVGAIHLVIFNFEGNTPT